MAKIDTHHTDVPLCDSNGALNNPSGQSSRRGLGAHYLETSINKRKESSTSHAYPNKPHTPN